MAVATETPTSDLEASFLADLTGAGKTSPEATTPTTTDDAATETETDAGDTDAGTETDADAAATTDSTTTDAEATATDDAVTTEDDSPTAIRDYFKEKLGPKSHAWLDTFKTDDDFEQAVNEQNKLIGRRNEDAEVGKWVRATGLTAQEIAAVAASRGNGDTKTASATTGTNGDEWNPAWVHTNAKTGAWEPTASAPADIENRIARYRVRLADAMADPAKLAEFIKPFIAKDIDAKTQAVRQEAEAKSAQTEQTRAFEAWQESKKALLLTDNGVTPLGAKVNEYLSSGTINPGLDWVAQAEAALKLASADLRPQPAKKPIPAKAKHQVAPAKGAAPKMTDHDFMEKYGDDIVQFAAWKERGELPAA
jgi:hypothetical protein